MEDPKNSVGHLLIEIRGSRSRSDVARSADMDVANLINIEEGRRAVGRRALVRILDALTVVDADRQRVIAAWMDMPSTDIPASVPTPEPQEVREVSDARPVVGTCGRPSCRGPIHALIEGDVWRGVRCDDCELETDLERARPAAEATQGAYRRNVA